MYMAMAYLNKVYTGLLVFPFLAALFTLPYAFSQYHRYGSVSKFRTLIVYSFILYMLIAYFQVILPLPDRATTVGSTWRGHLNLIPFHQIATYWYGKSLGFSTLRAYLTSFSLWQLLLNVVLTVPFGVYLRYYFRQSFRRTALYAFLLSLFYELTQLSALYWIYPGPYRYADVDDLICNTLGGVLGYWAASVFIRVLPSRETIDARSIAKGQTISSTRRVLAVLFDYACSLCLYLLLRGAVLILIPDSPTYSVYEPFNSWSFFSLFSLLQVLLTRGRTLGHALCRMTLSSREGGLASPWGMIKRYGLLWLFTELPLIVVKLLPSSAESMVWDLLVFLMYLVSRGYFVWYALHLLRKKGAQPMPHDRFSGTQYAATKIPNP